MNRFAVAAAVCAWVVAGLMVVGQGQTTELAVPSAMASPQNWLPQVAPAQPLVSSPLAALPADAIANVAERTVNSVVSISTSTDIKSAATGFHSPFGNPFGPSPFGDPQEDGEQLMPRGIGSGIIISADGRIITNAHVIEDADEIVVTLSDGNEYDAKLIGADKPTDVAVLQLQGKLPGLTPVTFGDSAGVRLGEVVIAIGNPLGVGQTVTMGIVSAKGRGLGRITDYQDFIQTDAAINPGNSGGALLNLRGELIGMNTAIASRTGGYQGMGFAIPSSMIRYVVGELGAKGEVSRGYLGIGIQTVNRKIAKEKGLPASRGVLVTEVAKDGPAGKAGVAQGDIIVALGGEPMTEDRILRTRVALSGAGKPVMLDLLRGKETKRIAVTTGELPKQVAAQGQPQVQKRFRGPDGRWYVVVPEENGNKRK
ncbi:MAG: trypsin-like peptidase domain-containing protein [Myxococcales bacterium]|nr:trypsin-like peptidase domain-containing protein [Myxococcales bacterium]